MSGKKRIFLLSGLVMLGVLFLSIGIWRGEAGTVWIKAIYICLECIGIG
nr:CD1871A family CXXC motif-containing protein [uncultured Merdimonas sp.]